jgi:hypothetical protein
MHTIKAPPMHVMEPPHAAMGPPLNRPPSPPRLQHQHHHLQRLDAQQ